MEKADNKQTRKKFLGLGAATVAIAAAARFFLPARKKEKVNMIKMLTQDGKLVEVDASRFTNIQKNKITDTQLKSWVNKKQG